MKKRLLPLLMALVLALLPGCQDPPEHLGRVWVAGDSITAGTYTGDGGWPTWLWFWTTNTAVPGSGLVYRGGGVPTIPEVLLGRIDATPPQLRPDTVLVMAGSNDEFHDVTLAQMVAAAARLEADLRARGVSRVVWVTPPPMKLPTPLLDDFRGWTVAHLDTAVCMVSPDELQDFVHPSPAANAKIGRCVANAL